MSYLDSLSKVTMPDGRILVGASFRGVPFFVESSSYNPGARRATVHEFYGGEISITSDSGKGAASFDLTGYVLGEDYTKHRDALIVALNSSSAPGELIHPYYGRKRAVCTSISVSEGTSDGGMATFNLGFEESPEAPAPTEIPDLSGKVATAVGAAFEANKSELLAGYDVSGQPAFAITSLNKNITNTAISLRSSLGEVSKSTQELASMDASLAIMIENASSLANAPEDLLDDLLSVMRSLASSEYLDIVSSAFTAYYASPVDDAIGTSSTRDRERTNQRLLSTAIGSQLVIEAINLIPKVEFGNVDQAEATRDEAVSIVDELLLVAGNDLYPALIALRAAVLDAIPGNSVIAQIHEVERRVDTPSLLLSYQLYGSVSGEKSVIAQNPIQHPSFISGKIKVLSDV